MAPTEDYEKDVCVQLCQTNQSNFSWESHRDYEYGACGYYDDALAQPHDLTPHYPTARQSANHGKMCSIDDCQNKTSFASFDYSVEHLRVDEANLNETQSRKNQTEICVRSDVSFFTIKNINIEKKLEEYLAEIGGNFGLFAGASILTLVEFGVLIVKIFKGILLNQRRPRKSVIYQIEEGKI